MRKPTDPKVLAMIFPHDDNCGTCEGARLMEKYVHPKMDGTTKEIRAATDLYKKKWKQSKYYKFAQECMAKGLDWQEEFKKRGWQP